MYCSSGRGEARVERDDDGAQLGRREGGDDELGPVGKGERDAVSGLDPQLVERRRQGVGLRVHLRVREPAVFERNEGPLRVFVHAQRKAVRERKTTKAVA